MRQKKFLGGIIGSVATSIIGGVAKKVVGSGALGPMGMLAGKLFKKGGKIKKGGKKRDAFTQQYD